MSSRSWRQNPLRPGNPAPDGLLEAYALPPGDGWWLAAVQWHPENLLAHAAHREMWEEFVRACVEYPPAVAHGSAAVEQADA